MSQMFYYCRFLTELDVAGFDTSNVENMSGMFASCIRVKSFNVNGFDTSKVTNMSMMFSECYNLKSLKHDVKAFYEHKVIEGLFRILQDFSKGSL